MPRPHSFMCFTCDNCSLFLKYIWAALHKMLLVYGIRIFNAVVYGIRSFCELLLREQRILENLCACVTYWCEFSCPYGIFSCIYLIFTGFCYELHLYWRCVVANWVDFTTILRVWSGSLRNFYVKYKYCFSYNNLNLIGKIE